MFISVYRPQLDLSRVSYCPVLRAAVRLTTSFRSCRLLEFGGFVVDGNSLVEDSQHSFATLIKPANLAAITRRSIACNHITQAMVARAPTFRSVAQQIFDLLDGRTWLGHNIVRFDIPQLTKHFQAAGLSPPQPAGVIDTLSLLKSHFGRRTSDLKMASLGRFFGQGEEKHRAMADARMTLNVIKHAGALLLLEQVDQVKTVKDEHLDIAGVGGNQQKETEGALEEGKQQGVEQEVEEEDISSPQMSVAVQPLLQPKSSDGRHSATLDPAADTIVSNHCAQIEKPQEQPVLELTAAATEVASNGLTDAQHLKVARNRARAMERRAKKLAERLRLVLWQQQQQQLEQQQQQQQQQQQH